MSFTQLTGSDPGDTGWVWHTSWKQDLTALFFFCFLLIVSSSVSLETFTLSFLSSQRCEQKAVEGASPSVAVLKCIRKSFNWHSALHVSAPGCLFAPLKRGHVAMAPICVLFHSPLLSRGRSALCGSADIILFHTADFTVGFALCFTLKARSARRERLWFVFVRWPPLKETEPAGELTAGLFCISVASDLQLPGALTPVVWAHVIQGNKLYLFFCLKKFLSASVPTFNKDLGAMSMQCLFLNVGDFVWLLPVLLPVLSHSQILKYCSHRMLKLHLKKETYFESPTRYCVLWFSALSTFITLSELMSFKNQRPALFSLPEQAFQPSGIKK